MNTTTMTVPSCFTCGCPVTDHAVDDEERRECIACECKQFELSPGQLEAIRVDSGTGK